MSTSRRPADEPTQSQLKGGQTVVAWGANVILAPGESLRWPLWLHPRSPGTLVYHLVWYFQLVTPVDGMKHR